MSDEGDGDDTQGTAALTERSSERFQALRERLREEYGPVETVEVTWRHPPGMYEGLVERFEAGEGGGAGAWVFDDEGRVLLLRQGHAWTDPGGKRRPGESFAETARRVVHEATGIEVAVEGVLEFHRVAVYDGTDPDRPTLVEPIVVFLARATGTGGEGAGGEGTDASATSPEPAGEREARWFAEPPEAAAYEGVERRPIPVDVD